MNYFGINSTDSNQVFFDVALTLFFSSSEFFSLRMTYAADFSFSSLSILIRFSL